MIEYDTIDNDELEPEGLDVIQMMGMDNIADYIEENELRNIGSKAKEDYEEDLASLDDYFDEYNEALKLAKQVKEEKTFPWRGAANVKVPLIGQAAMEFNARAYPEIVQGDKVVKAKVVGNDENEAKADRADRISQFMSFQLLDEMPNWESDTDKLLIMLPIIGTMFKEVTWNEIEDRPEDTLLLPDEIIVNYHSRSIELEECRRISKKLTVFKNDIFENERAGLWLEREYGTDGADYDTAIEEDEQLFIQQVRYLDLDDDGYEEPYIVTFHYESGEVVRIVANYDKNTVMFNPETEELVRIRPFRLYSDYHFIPAFDGCFYSTGFGTYLYPINKSIDTIINQLIDSGTLNNLQSGFLGKGLRTKTGSTPLKAGEWRPVDTKGMDLRANIVPLPTKEPSGTLFSLLMTLIDMGKQMSSITDVMAGVPQGANTPVGTTLAMIEQGMKVVDAVYKRVYRGMKKEFKMLYRLNSIYLPEQVYANALDDQGASLEDFNMKDFDVLPVGDTRISSQVMRTMKAQSAREIAMTTPNADIRAASMRVLESMDIQNPEEILPELPPSEVLMQQMDELKAYADTMTQQMQSLTQQLQGSEEARKDKELMLKAQETQTKMVESASKAQYNMAAAAEKLAQAEAQEIENDATESGLLELAQNINEAE